MTAANGIVKLKDGTELKGMLAIDNQGNVTVNIVGKNVEGAKDKNDYFVPASGYLYVEFSNIR